ncbi:MAG: hypothetical protein PWP27_1432 [Clostridiales bacterium]|jgi:arginine/lysine/ornithine decarboxylase|nr:hypothetical protein [Clostridiales bacterium]MDK2933622.1 hypothetical protein [Clostridiales bacterium]
MTYNTPLYSALINYTKENKIPFHMPGHKQGSGISARFKTSVFDIDLTELLETDNLHAPEGPIQEAQQLAAAAFGAQHSFFLINGSTCGIQAMVASICNPGDILIVDRNCHSSVISSLILCGVTPKYIYPEYIADLGVVGGIHPAKIQEMLIQCPQAKGVLITSPTYYGICSDVKKIAQIVHSHGKILLVDEAHGAHFCFHKKLPQSALQAGADMCVQSAHKTLPALTQSSLLHVNSDRIDLPRLKSCLKLFQSSSPSFILMAYLDIARSIMQNSGEKMLNDLIEWTEELRDRINRIGKIYCLGKELIGTCHIQDMDATRVVIHFGKLGLTGYQVARELNMRYNIQVEMADFHNIICIVSPGNNKQQLEYLGQCSQQISSIIYNKKTFNRTGYIKPIFKQPPIGQYTITPREVFYSESEIIPIEKAVDRVCADTIVSFPPGIPILCPGEVVCYDIIKYISEIIACGGKVVGLEDGCNIRVVKN